MSRGPLRGWQELSGHVRSGAQSTYQIVWRERVAVHCFKRLESHRCAVHRELPNGSTADEHDGPSG